MFPFLSGFEYSELGYGDAFAIRKRGTGGVTLRN
jgi:hypothetical protein